MIETLLGGLLGGAFRLAPEILKWMDRNGERSHELSMQDKALEFEKLRGAQRMSEIGANADAAWNTGAIDALKEAVAAQGQRSGVRWADALSEVGLDGPDAARDIHELRGLLDAFTEAKKTAGLTMVKMLVTGLVMALLAGAFVKLKLFGGAQ